VSQLSLLLPAPVPESPYARWLAHVDQCETGACPRAHEDLADRRRERDWEREVTVACEVGIRLLPMEELELAIGPQGLDRGGLSVAIARIRHQAERLRGRVYENTNVGVAWGGMR
jgi:hypothetical protein